MQDAHARTRLRLVGGTTVKDPHDGLVDRKVWAALEHMHEAPATEHTVASLARTVGLSRAAFARRFARATGTTPLRHLTRVRLALAAERLTKTDDSLAEIAWLVGYGTEFALSRAFKREHGVPPRTYRRLLSVPFAGGVASTLRLAA